MEIAIKLCLALKHCACGAYLCVLLAYL